MKTSVIKFPFGILKIKKDIVIGIMDEGTTIDIEKFKKISSYLTDHYKSKPYGYISYRKNSYAIDPTVYMHVSNKEILKAIAIVTDVQTTKTNAIIEKQFLTQPLKVFQCMSKAKKWLKIMIST